MRVQEITSEVAKFIKAIGAEAAIKSGFVAREIAPVTLPDGPVVTTEDGDVAVFETGVATK